MKFIVSFSIIINCLVSQSPVVKWGRTYGGEDYECGWDVLECSDNGFIALGSTNSFGNGGYDIYVIKTDSLGLAQWMKTYGGLNDDYGYGLCPAWDSGYIIVGSTSSSGNGMSDIIVIKIDRDGDSLWVRTYGDSLNEIGYSIIRVEHNSYVITGITSSTGSGGTDMYTIKIDQSGNLIWSKTYGGLFDDQAYCIDATDDGGHIIVGQTFSFGNGGGDIYIIKTDSLGEIEWERLYGSVQNEIGFCGKQTRDGGYIVCGGAYFTLLGYECCLLRYNNNGSLLWDNFQGSLSDDYAYSVQEIFQNNYVIAGNFSYEMYVARTDTEGWNIWSLIYGGSGTDCAFKVRQTADSGYIIVGITNSYGAGDYDLYLVRTETDSVGIINSPDKNLSCLKVLRCYPSVFVNELKILYSPDGSNLNPVVKIYNIAGEMVKEIKPFLICRNYIFEYIWDGNDQNGNPVPKGVYYIVVPSHKGCITKKVIKI